MNYQTNNWGDGATAMPNLKSLLITAILLATWPSPGTRVAAEECLRENMEGRLPVKSILSAVAVPDPNTRKEKIIITDLMGGMVLDLHIQGDGRLKESIPTKVGVDSLTGLKATAVAKKASGGFVQILRDWDNGGVPKGILFLDNSLEQRGYSELAYEDLRRPELLKNSTLEGRVLSLLDWAVAGDVIFAYGALGDPMFKEKMSMGFFTYQMKSPESRDVRPVASFVERFLDPSYYTLNYPYIVPLGLYVYYLKMGVSPELVAFNYQVPDEGGPLPLAGLRGEHWRLPPVSAADPSSYETARMPVGLYVAHQHLYVLYREPTNEHTLWTFDRLRPIPQSGEVDRLGSVRLPIRNDARRLTLVHMDDAAAWAIFEIAGQQSDKTHPVLSMVTIPDAWIEKRLTKSLTSFKTPVKSDCRLLD